MNPEVLVLDITMPLMGGLEVAQRLKESDLQARIVFRTIHQDPDFVRTAIEIGAETYIVKCRLASDLVAALRDALAGRKFVSPLE